MSQKADYREIVDFARALDAIALREIDGVRLVDRVGVKDAYLVAAEEACHIKP